MLIIQRKEMAKCRMFCVASYNAWCKSKKKLNTSKTNCNKIFNFYLFSPFRA